MGNVGSGLQGSCGFAAEGAGNYGIYSAPTRFIEGQADQLKKRKKIAQGTGIASGRLVDPGARRNVTTREAAGTVKAEVLDSGHGLLLAHALGSSVTTPNNGNRTVALTVVSGALTTLVDPLGGWTQADIGATAAGTGIAGTITAVANPWNATLSAPATAGVGVSTTLTHAAYTAYGQSHAIGNPQGLSLTCQIGLPDLAGAVHPMTYLGNKIESFEFATDIDKVLMATYALNARDTSEAQGLVSPSYPGTAHNFHFGQTNIMIGAFGSEATIEGVRNVSVKGDPQLRTDRYYQNNTGGLKREPVLKDQTKLTGSLDADYVAKADLADRFSADGAFSLIWTHTPTTNITGATVPPSFSVYAPQCFLEDTFALDSPDIVTGKLPFTITFDGTHQPLVVSYVSADVAL